MKIGRGRWPAGRCRRGRVGRLRKALVLLTTVMVVQVGIVAYGLLAGGPGTPWATLAIGDTLRVQASHGAGDESATVRLVRGTGVVTILYVFHSECVHSLEVAPKWAAHFADEQSADGRFDASGTRRIVVTRESLEVAASFAQQFGWNVQVVSLPQTVPDTPTPRDIHGSLLSRTPWVFVFDSDGSLHYHGHGNDLEALARSVRALPRKAADQAQLPNTDPSARSQVQ